jgi:DNA-binding transcriptional LysR family regulator
MLLDIVLLRSFVAVVEAKGFTRAAGFVNLTQSGVSLHIKRLEEQIGHRLFDRTAPKLALTSDGEILLSYAQRILALEEEVKTRLGDPQPEGLVRFGAPEYFDPGTLASLLAQFNSRYPAINLEIQMGIGTDIAALYGRGLLDVAIINREIDEADGAERSGNGPSEDTAVLYREGRVWAALRGMKLDSDRPVPLALFPAPLRLAAIGARAVAERRPPLDRRAAIHRAFRHHYCCGGGACDIDLRAERLKPAPAGARSRAGSPRPARLRIRRSPQRQAVVGGRPSARRHHRLFPARRRAAPYQRKY